MAIKLNDGIYALAPRAVDLKAYVGIGLHFNHQDNIPIPYRFSDMEVRNVNLSQSYRLDADLVTWVQINDNVPAWVLDPQNLVQLSAFGGQLDASRIDNLPAGTQPTDPNFSATALPYGSQPTVSGVHPNFIIGIPGGAPGQKGTPGNDGTAATINIGTVTSVAQGLEDIINVGSPLNAIFDFYIPIGDTGPQGLAATVDVNSTITGAAGSPASVVNLGTTSAADFQFVVPAGKTGPVGPQGAGVTIKGTDTYANIVAKAGLSGEMWIVSDDSAPDALAGDGLVSNGLGSGAANWQNVGPIRGPIGLTGLTPVISTLPTITGAAGTQASVLQGGTVDAPTFEFTIPRGDAGVDGINAKGWTGGSYDLPTGIVTFTSNDGLGFTTSDLRGAAGTNGLGWTGGSYDSATGIVIFSSVDGLGFFTGDLRGSNGLDGIDGTDGIGMPPGGSVGQVATKQSATDYDIIWQDTSSEIVEPTTDGNHVRKKAGIIFSWELETVTQVDNTPNNSATTVAISSDWAFVHTALEGIGSHVPSGGSQLDYLRGDGVWADFISAIDFSSAWRTSGTTIVTNPIINAGTGNVTFNQPVIGIDPTAPQEFVTKSYGDANYLGIASTVIPHKNPLIFKDGFNLSLGAVEIGDFVRIFIDNSLIDGFYLGGTIGDRLSYEIHNEISYIPSLKIPTNINLMSVIN